MKIRKQRTLEELEAYVKRTVATAKLRKTLRAARTFLEIEKNKAKLGDKFNPIDPFAEEIW